MSLLALEWILLGLLAAGALATATVVSHFSKKLITRRRGRRIEARLICPKTAAHVDCKLVHDDDTGRCLGVETCSRFGGAPACEQDCVKLINLGIPLRPPDR